MKQELVTTISGDTKEKSKCRKMKGDYYFIGDSNHENSGDCYFINGRYYKQNTGYIIFDHSLQTYVTKSDFKMNYNYIIDDGIVGFRDDNSPIFGSFSYKDIDSLIKINIEGHIYYTFNQKIVDDCFLYLENLEDGIYYNRYTLDTYKFFTPVNCDRNYKNSLPYTCDNEIKKVKKIYDSNYEPIYHNLLKEDIDFTKGLSFGLEFETTLGSIPKRIANNIGLIPLRDGSISGLEYVTIPLSENKGIQTVLDILDVLQKRTDFDSDCSLHLHVGNLPRTESFFLAVYKILFLLQDDIYSMFPFHKKENYGIKRKNYTKPLPYNNTMLLFDPIIKGEKDIKKNFSILYKFLSMNQSYSDVGSDINNIEYHPSDPRGNGKWNIRTRYHWVNLIPLLFGNKKTIEFRIHTPTYDKDKVINYMITCFSILDFVIKNEKDILENFNYYVNLNLNDIIGKYADSVYSRKLSKEFIRYYESRRSHFYNATSRGDFLADENKFSFRNYYFKWDEPSMTLSSSKSSDKLHDSLNRGDIGEIEVDPFPNFMMNNLR